MEVKERLAAIRKFLGYSQREMAEKLGLHVSSYNQLETGRNNLSRTAARLLRYMFYVNEDWLFHGKGEMLIDRDKGRPEKEKIKALEKELETYKKVVERLVNNTPEKS